MQEATLTGAMVALGSGLAIGIQATLFTLIGRTIGPVRASLFLNVTGGIVAGIILLAVLGIGGSKQWHISRGTLISAVIAVTLGLFIVTGVALAFQRTGVAVGVRDSVPGTAADWYHRRCVGMVRWRGNSI